MNVDSEKYLIQILEKIKSDNVALFVGAGASIPAGLPNSNDFIDLIKAHFKEIDQSTLEFMDVCQDVVETPPYDLNQLQSFVKEKLELVNITDSHKVLTKFNWAAIFTTNFDSVIELAYSTTPERLKSCYTISSDLPVVNISDRTKVYLFKLMGSIDSTEPNGNLVLTRSEYHQSILKRNSYLKILGDYIKSGTLLYIGYSFKDKIVRDIISSLKKIYGDERIPWSYMLLKDDIPTDPKSLHFFNSNKIIPVKCDFQSFFSFLNSNYDAESAEKIQILPKATLKLFSRSIEIDEYNYNMYLSCFTILSEESISQSNATIEDFLKGENKAWNSYAKNWDFKREAYLKDQKVKLSQKVLEELQISEVDKNKILYLSGMPGCGKTMLTNRIAYDVYSSGKAPVLFFSRSSNMDFKLIASFVEEINKQYDKQLLEDVKTRQLKTLMIFDETSVSLKDVNRLKEFLTSRGRPALFLIVGRENEIQKSADESKLRLDYSNYFTLDEKLNEDETSTIIDYLYTHRFITTKSIRWETFILDDYNASFFATIYSLIHPSKKPLNEIIKDQYNSLSDIGKVAYLNVCAFSQFDLGINIELLVRSLNISYDFFYEEILKKEAAKIIFEEEDHNGNVFYRSHHKIIAQKTLDFFLPDTKLLYEKYWEILESASLYNSVERDIIERLLIDNFSLKSTYIKFDIDQKRKLFEIVCKEYPTRSIMHHRGLIELDEGAFRDAEKYLNDALDLPRDESEFYKSESDQNILTSLGSLYSKNAMFFLQKGNEKSAEEEFKKAEECFKDAKHGEFPNSYAYHAHAYMWYNKSKSEKNQSKYLLAISKSLEILALAKDNLNAAEQQSVIELETLIWSQLSDKSKIDQYIGILRDEYKSAKGYYLASLMLYNSGLNTENEKDKEMYYKEALATIEDGLKYFVHDENCLMLRCKIALKLMPLDYEMLFEYLSEWSANYTYENAILLYEFGRVSFILGYYDLSKENFDLLERGIGLGNELRSKPRNPILDEKSLEPKVYTGEVHQFFSKYDGTIRVSSLSNKVIINFRPIVAKFSVYKTAPVRFNIAFSFRGANAINIIRG